MTEQQNELSSRPHVTLNSSGGIALGAFMAGVFFEIVKEALKEEEFVIDIITGASAGAMTGAIASYYLLQGKQALPAFDQPKGNALYEAWVTKADMEKIDSIDAMIIEEWEIFKKDRDSFGLLSGEAIKEIAELIKNHPSKINRPLALLMTVTNLQGLLLKNPNEEDKSVSSAEVRQFFFYPELEKDSKFSNIWEKVIVSSRMSGAFPVAFPPIKDCSDPSSINFQYLSDDYFEKWQIFSILFLIQQRLYQLALILLQYKVLNNKLSVVVKEDDDQELKLEFSYSDGGILDNLPILKGIELEADIVSKYSDSPRNVDYERFRNALYQKYPELKPKINDSAQNIQAERFHVYIQPNPVVNLERPKRLLQKLFTLWQIAISGLTLPHEEHETIQIKEILEIQKQIKLKQDLIKQFSDNEKVKEALQKAIPYQPIDLSPITPLIINKIEEEKKLSELKPIYDALIEHSPMIKEGLGESENLPDSVKLLASEFLGAFGGFFDKKYRVHDFLLGRIGGVTWLRRELEIQIPQATINELIGEIQQEKILSKEPKIKPSYVVRLFRIFLRFIRITILELEPIGIWNLIYYPLLVLAILVLRSLELITTIILWIVKDVLEKLFEIVF